MRPVVSDEAEDFYSRLGPWARSDGDGTDWALLHFCEAVASQLSPIEEVIRDQDGAPGWSQVLDPDRAPARWLPWLAQFVGLRIPGGLTEQQTRDYIKGVPASKRGTPGAIIAAAKPFLSGTQSVRFLERDTSPYHFTVLVRTSEAPADTTALLNALLSQKPAGLVMSLVVSDAPIINEFTRTIDSITATIDSLTLADVT